MKCFLESANKKDTQGLSARTIGMQDVLNYDRLKTYKRLYNKDI